MKNDKLIGQLAAAMALTPPLVIAPAAIQAVQWCRGKPERPLSDIIHTLKTGYAPAVR